MIKIHRLAVFLKDQSEECDTADMYACSECIYDSTGVQPEDIAEYTDYNADEISSVEHLDTYTGWQANDTECNICERTGYDINVENGDIAEDDEDWADPTWT